MRRQIAYIALLATVLGLAGTGTFLTISHAGGVTGIEWTQIGPQPLEINAESNFQGAGPDSGQVVDVAVDPRGATDQIIYITTQDGGVWQSTDGGGTWRTTTDFLNSLSIGAVVLDAGNPSVVYMGTGSTASNSFFKGIGVYKSTDLGATWTLTPGSATLNGLGIVRMVSPAANQLVIATHQGFFGGLGNGVFRSTDGGNSYVKTLNGQISDLHLDTTAANVVIAAVDIPAVNQGMFESTDGGATWGATCGPIRTGHRLLSLALRSGT